MRKKFYVFVLTIVILSANAVTTFGQDEVLSSYKRGKMMEISDLISREEHEDCTDGSDKRYGGTVSAVQFREGVQINNFTLKTANGSFKIYISPVVYLARISKQDAMSLPTLIAKGRRITVDTYRCGGAKKLITASYIVAGIQLDVLG